MITSSAATNYASITWSASGDGTFNDASALHPTYSPGANDIIAGTVTLTLNAIGLGVCSNASDEMVLTITPAPTADAGIDDAMCSTDVTYQLSGLASNASSVMWTTSGTGTFDDPTSLTPVYTPSLADFADVQVQLTLTANETTIPAHCLRLIFSRNINQASRTVAPE